MEEKIEKIVSKKLAYCPEVKESDIYRVHRFRVEELKAELSTLIQEERKDAVEGLLNKCCNKCRDLLYSNYALQGQEKKKRSVEKLVREK